MVLCFIPFLIGYFAHKMPGLEKIHLEDALEDNPQTRSMVGLFEQDAELLKDYIEALRNHCEKVLNAQRDLASATSNLSQHLKLYEKQPFPLDTDPDSVLKSTLKEFSTTLDEISSLQQVCASQLGDGMLFPLNRFIEADLTEIFTMSEMFSLASSEMEQAITKFCKAPKKRDGEKVRQEANEEVYLATKKFHQMALHYYANLNALQYKRKIALLEPMLGYIHALRSTFAVGNEILNTSQLETFLTNISSGVHGVQTELGQETQQTVDLIDSIEQQSQHLYYAEPLSDMPFIPPNTGLTQKSGYLFLKSKFAGMVTKWEHVYMYTLGSNLMSMAKCDVAGSVIMELDKTVAAQALENEDRRNVFHVTSAKKTVVLQALNERERDEWIATIHNITKELFTNREKSSLVKQPSKDMLSKFHINFNGNQSRKGNFDKKVTIAQQNVLDKQNIVSSLTSDNESNNSSDKRDSPSPSSSIDNFLLGTPIQFDMFSPAEERERSNSSEGPLQRTNPLEDSSSSESESTTTSKPVPFWEVFCVRFLGSMQVQKDRGEYLVYQTIRHIMAARAIHNVFKTNESHMVITHKTLKVLDPSHQAIRAVFPLEDISFWTSHKENNRLLGFITRSKVDSESCPSFHCHVFEAQPSADEICTALSSAANIALKVLLELENQAKDVELKVESEGSTVASAETQNLTEDKVTVENLVENPEAGDK